MEIVIRTRTEDHSKGLCKAFSEVSTASQCVCGVFGLEAQD